MEGFVGSQILVITLAQASFVAIVERDSQKQYRLTQRWGTKKDDALMMRRQQQRQKKDEQRLVERRER